MSYQIHRFHDKVSLYIGTGAPVYLTPAEAKRIAKALNAAAKDCTSQPDFSKSKFPTTRGTIANPGPHSES